MAEKQQLPLRALALAGAGACAVAGLSFVGQPSQVGHQDVKGLRGAQGVATPSTGYSSTVLPALVGAGALAAAVSQRASRVARRAEAKSFAGGIVGSKLHGWGEYQFDPLGLAEKYPENLAWFREAELKHGRVAMLAFLGLIVPDAFRFPIAPFTDSSLDVLNAHSKLIGKPLEGPMWCLLFACGMIECSRFRQLGLGFEKLTTENAGDLGLRGGYPSSAEAIESMKMKELKNGRLAMLAVGGCFTQGVAFGASHFPFIPQ